MKRFVIEIPVALLLAFLLSVLVSAPAFAATGVTAGGSWAELNHNWYFVNTDGTLRLGWIYDSNGWYYAKPDGRIYLNETAVIDGQIYVFDGDGRTQTAFKTPVMDMRRKNLSTKEKNVNEMADQILTGILNDKMTQQEKCAAIYQWVNQHMSYRNQPVKDSWIDAAYDGLRRKSGDCYTWYAVSVALLRRIGVQSLEVIRTDRHHWWNLINYGNGWYHFDTRDENGALCLLTDAELAAKKGIWAAFDHSQLPATPVK